MPDLVKIGNATLDRAAAADYGRALADGAPDNVESSYRDWNRQMELYQGWLAKKPGYNFALHPSESDHCKGLAVDVKGVAAKSWWRANGAKYGFHFTDKSEDWHIAYRPERAGYIAPVVAVRTETIERMYMSAKIVNVVGKSDLYLVNIESGYLFKIADLELAGVIQRVAGPIERIEINQREFNLAQAIARGIKAEMR